MTVRYNRRFPVCVACLVLACAALSILGQDVSTAARLAQAGDLAGAEREFACAVQASPLDPRALTGLGQVQVQQNKMRDGIDTFRKVVKLDPSSPETHINLGIALAADGQLTAALHQSSIALRLAPRDFAAHLLRGRVLADLNRNSEATSELGQVLAANPDSEQALLSLARLKDKTGQYKEQAALLRRYVTLEPNNPTAWLQLGEAYSRTAENSAAVDALRHAVSLLPNSTEALYALSGALRETSPEESKRLAERVAELRIEQHSLDRAVTLGAEANRSMEQGQYQAAAAKLKQALELCGHCIIQADLRKNLGLAFCHLGQLADGERELRTALVLKPKDRDIQLALDVAMRQRSGSQTGH